MARTEIQTTTRTTIQITDERTIDIIGMCGRIDNYHAVIQKADQALDGPTIKFNVL